jgi:ABC-type branched-subunit amino acid transport system substrate-binding protein
MKNDRLLAVMPILFLAVFLISWSSGHEAAVKSAAAAEVKSIEKSLPAVEAGSSEVKPPVVLQPEISPPVLAPLSEPVNRHAVGCIFPLTGRFADAGNKALDAVLLSAKIFNQGSYSPWKVVAADSGETPEGIKKAVSYLADQAKVIAIIAIAGTAEAAIAAIEAQKRQVPLILIASREGVTEVGEYVFQHFLTPAQQIQALTKYAGHTLNVAIFAVLYPEDDYGEEMLRLFRGEIKKSGGKVDKAIPYSKKQTDFTEQIKKLMGDKLGASENVHTPMGESKGRWSADFEALFIPDSSLRVKMIASQLAFYDVKAVQLIGTSLWHSSDLLKKGAEYLEGAVFPDSFLVNGILPETNDFVDVYYSAYSREPGNIDALAYDTMALTLGVLQNHEIKTRTEFIKALLAVQGFRGVTGSISFHGSRVAQKDAFILKVQNGKLEQVE